MFGEEACGLWVALASAPGIERVAEYPYTPAAALWFFVNTFTYARLPSDQPHEGAPGWVRWCDAAISRYHKKTCLFVRFFRSRTAKIQNNAIFVHIEDRRFAAMFEQAELRGIPMGPNGPPNAKETA